MISLTYLPHFMGCSEVNPAADPSHDRAELCSYCFPVWQRHALTADFAERVRIVRYARICSSAESRRLARLLRHA